MEGQVKSEASLVGEWSLPEIVNAGNIGVTSKTVTLFANSWLTDATYGYIYRVAVDGVTADPTKSHVFCSVVSDTNENTAIAMEKEAAECWVRLRKQEDGAVMFQSLNGTKPTIDIAMNILVVVV